MRIAMVGWEFPPFISGGLGTHCFELTRALGREGVEIDFFMPKTEGEIDVTFPGVRIVRVAETTLRPYLFQSSGKAAKMQMYGGEFVRATEIYNREVARVVALLHKERHYDLIHGHDWLTINACRMLRDQLKIPWLHTFHSTEIDRNPVPWDFLLDIEKLGLREADMVIAVSKHMKGQLLKLGADGGKIRVVYNGVDAASFDKKKHELEKGRKHWKEGAPGKGRHESMRSFAPDKKIVLFLGRLTEQKGPLEFLRAAKKVLEKREDVVFLVAGKGHLLPSMINLCLQLGIMDHVIFLGHIPENEKRKIYSLSDVYVMPSVSEPFGITALEAMASGTPIIISRTSGVGEVSRSALKVDFWDTDLLAEKILALLKYKTLHRAISRFGLGEVERLSWGKAASDTVIVYSELLDKGTKK